MGAIIGDVTVSPFGAYADCGSLISRSEAYAIHQHWLRTTPELYGAFGRHRLMAGAFILAADYINAQRERTRLVAELAETMKTVDAADLPHRPLSRPSDRRGLRWHPVFSLSSTAPSTSPAVPLCRSATASAPTGLPLSLQIGGRPFEDALVLQIGDALERTLGTRTRRPALSEPQ